MNVLAAFKALIECVNAEFSGRACGDVAELELGFDAHEVELVAAESSGPRG